MFSAMTYTTGRLDLIDQRLLPDSEVWLRCVQLEEVARAIEDMVIRGAPAIGCAAAFALALDALTAATAAPKGRFADYQVRFDTGSYA